MNQSKLAGDYRFNRDLEYWEYLFDEGDWRESVSLSEYNEKEGIAALQEANHVTIHEYEP